MSDPRARLGPCSSSTSPRPPPRSVRSRRGSAKIRRIADLLTAAATEADPSSSPSWWPGCPVNCRSARSGSAGRRCDRFRPPPAEPSLTVAGVDATFTEIGAVSGKGSQTRRSELVAAVFAAATDDEQTFLRRLLGGELRQGALVGVMADAVAEGRRRSRRRGASRRDARRRPAGRRGGGADRRRGRARASSRCRSARPVGPMLAQTATGVDEALEKLGGTAVFEAKLDGARVQIHRAGDERIDLHPQPRRRHGPTARSRRGRAARCPPPTLIADAEAIALRPDGRPHRFQVTASRFGRGGCRRRGGRGPHNRCRCSSSTSSTSTAPICWTCRPPSGSRPSTRWCPPAQPRRPPDDLGRRDAQRRSWRPPWPPDTKA